MPIPRSELYVITMAKKMTEYIFLIEEKSPKKFRGSLISKMDNACLDLIELLYESNSIRVGDETRLIKQKQCQIKLRMISFISEAGQKHGCYTFHQYETICKYLSDCNTYLLSWMKSDRDRCSNKGEVNLDVS